jgi:hypothetical protein
MAKVQITLVLEEIEEERHPVQDLIIETELLREEEILKAKNNYKKREA